MLDTHLQHVLEHGTPTSGPNVLACSTSCTGCTELVFTSHGIILNGFTLLVILDLVDMH